MKTAAEERQSLPRLNLVIGCAKTTGQADLMGRVDPVNLHTIPNHSNKVNFQALRATHNLDLQVLIVDERALSQTLSTVEMLLKDRSRVHVVERIEAGLAGIEGEVATMLLRTNMPLSKFLTDIHFHSLNLLRSHRPSP